MPYYENVHFTIHGKNNKHTTGSAGLKLPIHALFQWAILTRKVGQTDLVFLCNQSAIVGLRM